jgi:hypothetical protein
MPILRLEFFRLGVARGRLGGQVDLREAEPLAGCSLEVTAIPTSGPGRPMVPEGGGTVFADLWAVGAPLYVDVGVAPDPASEPRMLVVPGERLRVHATPGHRVSAVLASDLGLSGPVDRSGVLAAAGAAQQACGANAFRRLLIVSNPDGESAFWFSTTGPAAPGAGSHQVGPGGAFVFDRIVPSGAVSVVGQVAGQPFTMKEA